MVNIKLVPAEDVREETVYEKNVKLKNKIIQTRKQLEEYEKELKELEGS